MTNKTKQVTDVNLENDIQSNEDKSKVLDLQTLSEISAGVSDDSPNSAFLSIYCNHHEQN